MHVQKRSVRQNFAEWAELGGMMNLIHAQEIDAGNVKKVFKIITDRTNAWDVIKGIPSGYKNGVQNLQEFREAILRYSLICSTKKKVTSKRRYNGLRCFKPQYSFAALIQSSFKAYQALKDPVRARMTKFPAMGQTIRRHLIPFYSFLGNKP